MWTKDRVIFMALGGAQEVGASCYFLRLGERNFLLDCGQGRGWNNFTPKFEALLATPYVQDFRQISHVIISHAHLDHVGALPEFLALNERSTVYMTDLTWRITKMQLAERLSVLAQEKISRITFLQEIPLRNLTVSFHQAGHIPGAMMTLFKFGGRNILYTGDYSTFPTPLVGAAVLPNEKIDVLILCGLHARHCGYRTNDAALERIFRQINFALARNMTAYCQINQVSRGVELLSAINKFLPNVEVFIDDKVMDVVHSFEAAQIRVMNAQDHPLSNFSYTPSVIISTEPPPHRSFWIVNSNFSLHDDFEAVVNFVRRINPKICVVVHSPPDRNFFSGETVEQVLISDPTSRTDFIFPETGEVFEI